MRQTRALILTILFAHFCVSGCSPDTSRRQATVVVSGADFAPEKQSLPAPVLETLAELRRIADVGQYQDLARLAAQTPEFRSNWAGMSHRDFWYLKLRVGDWPMAHVGRVLEFDPGVETVDGAQIYVWPYLATRRPRDLAEREIEDAESLVGEEGLADFLFSGEWPGYRLGVREDGRWMYFYTAADREP